VISKIAISTGDRDQIGVNSPRGVEARPKTTNPTSGSKIS